jgi:hypothetical protein
MPSIEPLVCGHQALMPSPVSLSSCVHTTTAANGGHHAASTPEPAFPLRISSELHSVDQAGTDSLSLWDTPASGIRISADRARESLDITVPIGTSVQCPRRTAAPARTAQFTSANFLAGLEAQAVRISMDGKGRYLDNIFIERLWRSLMKRFSSRPTGHRPKRGVGSERG